MCYNQRFGYYNTENVVEIVNLRIRAIAPLQGQSFHKRELHGPDPSEALICKRPAMISGVVYEVSVYDRGLLFPGNVVNGPSVIAEYSATTLLPPELICRVDEYGNPTLSYQRFSLEHSKGIGEGCIPHQDGIHHGVFGIWARIGR